jgi:hypothetical protein
LPLSLASRPRTTQGKKVTIDEEFLKAAEVAIADRRRLQEESRAKDELLTAKDSQIAALRALLALEKQTAKDWMEAALNRKEALRVDDKVIALYDQQILRLNERVASAERAKFRWGLIGVVIGALAAGYVK